MCIAESRAIHSTYQVSAGCQCAGVYSVYMWEMCVTRVSSWKVARGFLEPPCSPPIAHARDSPSSQYPQRRARKCEKFEWRKKKHVTPQRMNCATIHTRNKSWLSFVWTSCAQMHIFSYRASDSWREKKIASVRREQHKKSERCMTHENWSVGLFSAITHSKKCR